MSSFLADIFASIWYAASLGTSEDNLCFLNCWSCHCQCSSYCWSEELCLTYPCTGTWILQVLGLTKVVSCYCLKRQEFMEELHFLRHALGNSMFSWVWCQRARKMRGRGHLRGTTLVAFIGSCKATWIIYDSSALLKELRECTSLVFQI